MIRLIPILAQFDSQDVTDQFVNELLRSPVLLAAAWAAAWLVPLGVGGYVLYFLLTLPLRRRERARLFLHLVETGLAQGQNVEQTIVAAARSGDRGLPVRFHLLAAHLENGLSLSAALDRVPRLLPPQVNAMLKVGEELGDLRGVLPACQRLLQDAVSQTSGAHNFVMMLGLLPAAPVILSIIMVWVLPRFQEIFKDMMPGEALPPFTIFFFSVALGIMVVQVALFLIVHALALCYAGGPRLRRWLGALLNPALDGLLYCLPWRRRRMQRDFAAMLALLLDAGVNEKQAVGLAADCTTNRVFLNRAHAVEDALQAGHPLPEALQRLDETGEFQWRLLNARHSPQGFRAALAGWLESLDAKAYQQEQAAAQLVTTVMVGLNGLLIGMFAVAMFLPLVKLMEMATW